MSLQIRLATPEDAPAIQAIYAPIVENTAISFEFEPPTIEEMARRIGSLLLRFPWLVCEEAGQVLGYAYAGSHSDRAAYQWSVNVSVYVHERARGRSVGTALYAALFRLLALQGFYTAFAGITLPNPASVGLHESVGFTKLGVYHDVGYKMGRWHETGWFERRLKPLELEPAPPLRLADVAGSGEWESALAEEVRKVRARTNG